MMSLVEANILLDICIFSAHWLHHNMKSQNFLHNSLTSLHQERAYTPFGHFFSQAYTHTPICLNVYIKMLFYMQYAFHLYAFGGGSTWMSLNLSLG